jgi:MoxR-like ATPase
MNRHFTLVFTCSICFSWCYHTEPEGFMLIVVYIIFAVDEIDKMPMKDQEGLLNIMERGEFVSTKVRNTKTVKANIVIFATSNSIERLSKPLLSRFTVFEIPSYTVLKE